MPCPDVLPDAVTHLYAKNRSAIEGAVEMYYYEVYAMWSGTGSLTLETNVRAAGKYEIALCCSVLADSIDVHVEIAGRKVTAKLARTWGVWNVPDKLDYNFERVLLDGTLDLPEGPATVKVSLTGELPAKAFNLVSMELTPAAAKAAIDEAERAGLAYKAEADWFVEAGYGLMFHWTDGAAPRHGNRKPYGQAVDDFDVDAWAAMVEDTGAAYVFLTANHGSPHFPAPLEFWAKVHPGWTTRRDLIGEMIVALERRDIRMALYLNCPTFGGLKTREQELEEYFELNCRMFEEVGCRYGRHVAAYWLDSWYQPYVKYGRFPIQEMFRATKAGWKDRLVAFNHWVFPVPTLCQDYWCGEVYQTLVDPIETRFFQAGAAKGLQYHALLALDDWGIPPAGAKPAVWSGKELANYIRRAIAAQGVVTVNLGIYQDGTITEATAEVMRIVRRAIRG
ncbi:MAG: alpha-L-fucosidase [Planctomycetota bacterium]|jgi:hypothetical protein